MELPPGCNGSDVLPPAPAAAGPNLQWLRQLTAAQVVAGTIMSWPTNVSFEQLLRVTDEISPRPAWCGMAVNVGASDGVGPPVGYDETGSLFAAGFRGLVIEADEARFNVTLPKNLGPNVSKLFAEVTPGTIAAELESHRIPTEFEALKVDSERTAGFVPKHKACVPSPSSPVFHTLSSRHSRLLRPPASARHAACGLSPPRPLCPCQLRCAAADRVPHRA